MLVRTRFRSPKWADVQLVTGRRRRGCCFYISQGKVISHTRSKKSGDAGTEWRHKVPYTAVVGVPFPFLPCFLHSLCAGRAIGRARQGKARSYSCPTKEVQAPSEYLQLRFQIEGWRLRNGQAGLAPAFEWPLVASWSSPTGECLYPGQPGPAQCRQPAAVGGSAARHVLRCVHAGHTIAVVT